MDKTAVCIAEECIVQVCELDGVAAEGGDCGGTVVCSGTPEQVAKCEKSYTGQFLKKML